MCVRDRSGEDQSYVCGCERDEERVHVTRIQTNIGEKLDPKRRSFVSAREKDISQRE